MIILDIDNCIADDGWRIPRIDWARKGDARYHTYHTLAPFDAVGNRELYAYEAALVLTGRPVTYRAATEEWLRRAGVRVKHLLMRNENDPRSTPTVKAGQLWWLRDFYDIPINSIRIAYDDRADICAMYRAAGLNAERRAIHDVCAYTNPLTSEAHP